MANFCTQLQTKLDFAEQELLKAKDKENTMAIDLGRLESEVRILTAQLYFPNYSIVIHTPPPPSPFPSLLL